MDSLTERAATDLRIRSPSAAYIRIGALASVCREWQIIIENATFRYLKLVPADLERLGKIVSDDQLRRQSSIRDIQFHAVLPDYDRPPLLFSLTRRRGKEKAAFADAVAQLFSTLHAWDSSAVTQGSRRGLVLEITTSSPSDPSDPGGVDAFDPRGRARMRFLPLSLPFQAAPVLFKPVPVVTAFRTGRRPCRNLHYKTLATILGRFPNLRTLQLISPIQSLLMSSKPGKAKPP